MCGIFASTAAEAWRDQVPAILGHLSRRGPDAHGSTEADGVLLAQTRLSIIGLGPDGQQPATSRNGRIRVVYNGEIYNYREVAQQLGLEGLRSDTQVLAEVLARDPASIGILRGMYAFVATDTRTGTVYAARDPYGIKPLYLLQHDDGELTFASQISPLLAHPDARVVDRIGVGAFLAFGHTGPGLTVYEAVRKVEKGRLHVWSRAASGFERSSAQVKAPPRQTATLAEALEDSVRAHLTADVEVGTFLSGGIDSTLLTLLASRSQVVRSFTVGFPDNPERDESPLAVHNARLMGVDHTVLPATMADLVGAVEPFMREHGEPFGDAALMPLTHLSLHVGKQLRVVLCGEGADELFGGYARYKVSARIPRSRAVPLPRRGWLADRYGLRRGGRPWERTIEAALAGGGFRGHAALLDSELPLLELLSPAVRRDVEALSGSGWASSGADDLERARHHDTDVWLTNVFLEKTDRATMAGSLEARVPFLDHEVVAAAHGLHPGADTSKAALRSILTEALPGVVLPDRKKGLAVELPALLSGFFAGHLDRQLRDPTAALSQFAGRVDDGAVKARADRSPAFAFRLVMLDVWDRLYGADLVWRNGA